MPAAPDLPRMPLSAFPVRRVLTTRWADNDMYGHLNNAVYYGLFDAAVNAWTAPRTGSFSAADVIGVVAESGCRFHEQLAFPQPVTVGLAVARVGASSVTYRLGAFAGEAPAEDDGSAATGHWVHVYVDRATGRPVPIPEALRALFVTAGDVPG